MEERAGVAYNGIDRGWIACRRVAAASIRAALVITGHGRRGPGSVGKRDMKNRANAHLSLRAAAATKNLPSAAASNTRFLWREKSSLTMVSPYAGTKHVSIRRIWQVIGRWRTLLSWSLARAAPSCASRRPLVGR